MESVQHCSPVISRILSFLPLTVWARLQLVSRAWKSAVIDNLKNLKSVNNASRDLGTLAGLRWLAPKAPKVSLVTGLRFPGINAVMDALLGFPSLTILDLSEVRDRNGDFQVHRALLLRLLRQIAPHVRSIDLSEIEFQPLDEFNPKEQMEKRAFRAEVVRIFQEFHKLEALVLSKDFRDLGLDLLNALPSPEKLACLRVEECYLVWCHQDIVLRFPRLTHLATWDRTNFNDDNIHKTANMLAAMGHTLNSISLDIRGFPRFDKIQQTLRSFTAVTDLKFHIDAQIRNSTEALYVVCSLTQLRSLTISNIRSMDLSRFQNLQNLERLSLYLLEPYHDFSFTENLPRLKKLTLFIAIEPRKPIYEVFVPARIESLTLAIATCIRDSPIAFRFGQPELNLKRLHLKELVTCLPLLDTFSPLFEHCPQLEEMVFGLRYYGEENFGKQELESLERNCPKLRTLELRSLRPLRPRVVRLSERALPLIQRYSKITNVKVKIDGQE